MKEDRMLSDEILLGLINKNKGGGGGTTNYNNLENKPQIGGVTLQGNKTASELGLADSDTVGDILNGTNIDSFGDVETALATKVNKVEGKGLSTNDFTDAYKTAIGDNTTAIEAIDSKIDDATTYPYADVITVSDAVPANLADCSVKIEPIQDLHGYDKPWVGGAGKNKLPLDLATIKSINTSGTWNGNTYSENGATATVLTDNDGNIVGIKAEAQNTPSSTFIFNLCFKNKQLEALENVSVTMNGCPTNGSSDSYAMQFYLYNGSDNVTEYGSGVTFTPSNLISSSRVRIVVKTATPTGGLTFYPMIRLSTETDSTFAPYTNICPISRHTEVDVQRDGKNKADPSKLYLFNNNRYVSTNDFNNVGSYDVKPNTEYRLLSGKGGSADKRIKFWNAEGNLISNASSAIFTTPNNCAKISFYWQLPSEVQTVEEAEMMLCLSQYTSFEPYAGKTYTLALGDTIYGGTVDFDSGVCSVIYGYADMGDIDWTYDLTANVFVSSDIDNLKDKTYTADDGLLCSIYSIANVVASEMPDCTMRYRDDPQHPNRIIVKDTRYDDATAFKTAMDGVQLVYELATPTTIQLTPEQIQLLKGQNTLYASTGDISVTVNGVSGAIGQVQEQVNELADEVAEIKPVNYSITEQATGRKWLNKPTYLVVIDMGEEKTVASNTWYTVGNHLGSETIVNGMGITGSGGTVPIQIVEDTNDGIKILQTRNAQVGVRYVWLEYIKTT